MAEAKLTLETIEPVGLRVLVRKDEERRTAAELLALRTRDLDDRADDAHSQSAAVLLRREERLRHFLEVLSWDTVTVILDDHYRIFRISIQRNLDRSSIRQGVNRIQEDVQDRLLNALVVARNHHVPLGEPIDHFD